MWKGGVYLSNGEEVQRVQAADMAKRVRDIKRKRR